MNNKEGLIIRGLTKSYYFPDELRIIDDFDLQVKPGESIALLGENGCGKSTLLRCIAGADSFSGLITLNGEPIRLGKTNIGLIWQDTTSVLLPWLTGLQNAAIGLELRKRASEPGLLPALRRATLSKRSFFNDVYERIRRVMKDLNVPPELEQKYPYEMSGGERQLILLSRIMAIEPEIILADEPTHGLDYRRQAEIQQVLANIVGLRRCITLLVTHDAEEALLCSDRAIALGTRPLRKLGVIESPFSWPRDIRMIRPTRELQEKRERLIVAAEMQSGLAVEGNRGRER